MGSAPEVTPSPGPQGWSTQSTGYEKDVPQRERKSLHLGQGHTFLGEIPSERNNSSEKENNRLFSGQAEREPGVIPRAVPSPVGSPGSANTDTSMGIFCCACPQAKDSDREAAQSPRGRGSLRLSSEKSAWPFLSELPHPLGKAQQLICKSAQRPLGVGTSGLTTQWQSVNPK